MIFVTGTGRCGTSSVARVLHQKGIACMGHKFIEADDLNPQGYWEDLEILHDGIDDLVIHNNPGVFYGKVRRYHASKSCDAATYLRLAGFKHPLLHKVSRETWLAAKPTAVYWCIREKEATIESMMKFRTFKRGKSARALANNLYELRMEDLEENLAGLPFVKVIDFNVRRSDEWILKQLC